MTQSGTPHVAEKAADQASGHDVARAGNHDVIVLAHHAGLDLDALTGDTCQALLPVVGKPVVEHVIEAASRLSPGRILVSACRGLERLQDFIGNGSRWGVETHIITTTESSDGPALLHKHAGSLGDRVLILDCLSLLDVDMSRAVALLDGQGRPASRLLCAGKDTGMALYCRNSDATFVTDDVDDVDMPDGSIHDVGSLQTYFDANLALAHRQEDSHLNFRGRAQALGLVCGAGTRITPASIELGRVHAGSRTVAHRSSVFSGTVIVGSDVVIDSGCRLRDSLVLDNTYVGSDLTVERSIVHGKRLICMDTGSVVDLDDPHLLSSIAACDVPDVVNRVANQVTGLMALLLSLPLWLPALITAMLLHPAAPVLVRRCVGNRLVGIRDDKREFSAYSFNCHSQLLSGLPKLLCVAAGHIRWSGVSMLSPVEHAQRTEGWEKVRDRHPVGLLGPTQLAMEASTPLAERLMSDALYAEWRMTDLADALLQRARRPVGLMKV